MDDLKLHGLIGGIGGIKDFFGDGSDGVLDTTGNVTLSSVQNGPALVKQYESIKINTGHFLTISNPCKALVLYSKSDVIIDGEISVSKKSPDIASTLPNKIKRDLTLDLIGDAFGMSFGEKGGCGGDGGSGGYASSASAGVGGKGSYNSLYGGGYGGSGGVGGCYTNQSPGKIQPGQIGSNGPLLFEKSGAPGTGNILYSNAIQSVIGGVGSKSSAPGGSSLSCYTHTSSYYQRGGTGGTGYGGGGGAGGNASAAFTGSSIGGTGGSGEYAGGVLVIIAKGNIIINSNGKISAKGGNGGNGGNPTLQMSTNMVWVGGSGGGGGAGGGHIALLLRGEFINNGTIDVSGGLGGAGSSYATGGNSAQNGFSGTSGSLGTIEIISINEG
ncbi:MAG: hypothetical protein JXR88_12585 [Clostridia bacterium]|nr:hypothetical protein [Clostridia bacterium]